MALGPAVNHPTSRHVHRTLVGHSVVVAARPPPQEVVARRGLTEATLMVRARLVAMTPTVTALGLTS